MSRRGISGGNLFDDWDETPINQMNSTARSNNDLKSQLFDLQKQLNLGDIRPVRAARNEDPQIVLPPITSASLVSSGSSENSVKPLSKNVDNSVDFLGDLSDNLLMKSRKLNYENQKLMKEIDELKNNNESISKQVSNLTLLNKQLSDNEEEQNSNIWKLESELQNINSQLETSQDEVEKLQLSKEKSEIEIHHLKNTLDQLESEMKTSIDSNKSTIDKLTSRLNEAKESNDSLSNENDLLAKTIDELRTEIEKVKSENQLLSNKHSSPQHDESFSEFDDSILVDPVASSFMNHDLSNLDSAALKQNLENTHRKLLKLLSQNSKLKIELNKHNHKGKQNILDPIINHNSNNENQKDQSWTAFNDDSFIKQGKGTITDMVLNSDDADDGLNFSDIEALDGSSPVSSRKPSFSATTKSSSVPDKQSYMLLLPKTTLDTSPSPNLLHLDFTKFQTVPVPNTIVDTLIKESEKHKNFVSDLELVSKDVIEELNQEVAQLNKQLEHPSLDYIKEKSKVFNFVLTEKPDHDATSAELTEKSTKLVEVSKELQHTSEDLKTLEIRFNELETAYQNLDVSYAASKLVDHKILSVTEFNQLHNHQTSLEAQLKAKHDQIEDIKAKHQYLVDENQKEIVEMQKNHSSILAEKSALIETLKSELASAFESLESVKSELAQLSQTYENPDITYIKSKAVDHVVLHSNDHYKLLDKIKDSESRLTEVEFLLATKTDEFVQLHNSYTNPTIEYMMSKAANHVIIPTTEHSELMESIQSKSAAVTKLEGELSAKSDVLQKLQSMYDSPSISYMTEKAEAMKYKFMPDSEYSSLNDKISALEEQIENPSIGYIKEKSEKLGYVAVLIEDFEKLNSTVTAPHLDFLKTNAENHKHAVIPVAELNEFKSSVEERNTLLSKLDSPALDYLNEKSAELKHVVVPVEEHTDLVKNYSTLKSSFESPTIEYLESKAAIHSHLIVPKKEYDDLVTKSADFEQQNSENIAKLELANEALAQNREKLVKSDIANQHALTSIINLQEKINLSTQNLAELTNNLESLKEQNKSLMSKLDSPSLDYLSEKSTLLNYSILPETEHIEMKSKFTVLDAQLKDKEEHINSLAESKAQLQQNHDDLNTQLTTLETHFKELKSRLDILQLSHDSPEIEYLKSKADRLNSTVILLEEYNLLIEQNLKNDVTIKELNAKMHENEKVVSELQSELLASNNKLKYLETALTDLESKNIQLSNAIESPDADYISSKASSHKLVTVPVAEHSHMHEQIKMKDAEIEMFKTVKSELDAKHAEIEELAKVKNDLSSEIESFKKLIESKEADLKSLQGEFDFPSAEYIKNKSAIHGLTAVPMTEYESTKEQLSDTSNALASMENELESLQRVKKDLEIQGFNSVSLDLHDSVQKELHDTRSELDDYKKKAAEQNTKLEQHAKELEGLKDVESKLQLRDVEFATLLEKSDELSTKARKLDEVTIELDSNRIKLNKMVESKAEMQKKIDLLMVKERELEETLSHLDITKSQLSDMRAVYESPDFKYVEEKCKTLGYVPITMKEVDNHESNSRLVKELKNNIEHLEGQVVALSTQNNELDELKTSLQKDVEEMVNLKKQLENPSADFIKEKSSIHNLVAIPASTHSELNSTVADLNSKVVSLESKLDSSKKEKQILEGKVADLESKHSSPSMDYISSKLPSLGFIPIPIVEHTSLKSDLQRKDLLLKQNEKQLAKLEILKTDLDTHQKELRHTISKLGSLTEAYEHPSIDYLKNKLSEYNYITIADSDHNSLINSKTEALNLVDEKEKKLESVNSEFQKYKEETEEELERLESACEVAEGHIGQHTKALEIKTEEWESKQKEFEAQIKEHNDKISVLSSKITEQETELKSKNSELADSSVKIDCLNSQVVELEAEIDTQKSELLDTRNKIEEQNLERERLFETVKSLESQISLSQIDLITSTSNFEQTKLEHNEKTIALNSELQSLKTKLAESENLIQEKEKEILANGTELDNAQSELKIKDEAYVASMEELSEIKTQLEEKSEIIAGFIAETERMKNSHETVVVSLRNELDSISEKLVASEKELELIQKNHEAEIVELNAEVVSLKATLNTLTAQLQSKSAEVDEIVEELEESKRLYNDKILELEEQESTYITRLAAIEMELKTKNIEIETISAQFANTKNTHIAEVNKLNSESSELTSRISSIELELQEKDLQFQAEKAGLESALAARQSEVDELRNSNNIFETELADLKFEIEAKNNELDDINIQLEEIKKNSVEDSYAIPVQNFEMAKSSSNATITSNVLDELARQPIESLVTILQQKGYVVLPHEEFNKIIVDKHSSATDELENITHEMEDIEHDLETKQRALEELETKSKSDAESFNSSVHSEMIPVEKVLTEKYNAVNAKVNFITSEISELRAKREVLQKQQNRLSMASFDEATKTLNHKISKKIEKVDGEIEIKQVELKLQKSALAAVHAYIAKSKDLDLPPITHVISSDSTDQMVHLEKEITELRSEYDHKKQALNALQSEINLSDAPKRLATKLASLGYTVVAPSGEQLSLKGIILHGLRFSIHSLVRMEHFDKNTGTSNIDGLIRKKGYALVPAAEVDRLRKSSILNIADIREKALKLGFVVVSEADMKDMVEKSKNAKLPEALTVDELQQLAGRVNFEMVPTLEMKKLRQRKITTHDLAKKAESLKLVLLSREDAAKLKVNTPITKENIVEKGKEFDLLCIPAKQFVATTVSKVPDIANVTVLPNSYYSVLSKSHELYKKHKQATRVSATNHNRSASPSMSPSPSIHDNNGGFEQFSNKHLLPPPNITNLPGQFDAVSLATVDSVISNKKEIIAAITQTMLGTFLYKYYRKLGPLTSISDTRHERFFWINPYSLSLLWCISNPGACDPGKANIKAATILDVKSVLDNNPLPAGLYYKSLVITSYDKTVKITCPTRRIHNIWYNALKYLLDRSLDNWINDDDLENQYEQDFSLDKKTEIERSQSQYFRRSQQPSIKMHANIMSNRAPPKSAASIRSKSFYRSP